MHSNVTLISLKLVPKIKLVVYITRSIHPVENEFIVEEVKDILGSGWKLEPVFPEITDDRHYDYEIGVFKATDSLDETLKVSPSFEFGNGIFVAAFKRWNQKDQEEAREIEAAANKARIPVQVQEVKKKKKVS